MTDKIFRKIHEISEAWNFVHKKPVLISPGMVLDPKILSEPCLRKAWDSVVSIIKILEAKFKIAEKDPIYKDNWRLEMWKASV